MSGLFVASFVLAWKPGTIGDIETLFMSSVLGDRKEIFICELIFRISINTKVAVETFAD